jgi:Protein of unknown function (DUF4244)
MRSQPRPTPSRRALDRDDGMSTAEYAIGTLAAAAFAGLLFKILTSREVEQLMLGVIHRALGLAA